MVRSDDGSDRDSDSDSDLDPDLDPDANGGPVSDPDSGRGRDSAPSGSPRVRRVALAFAVVLLGSSVFLRSSPVDIAGAGTTGPLVLGVGGILIVLALLWPSSDDDADHDEGDTDETDDSSVWNAIPSWQYEGRHVESGGLARSEQEQALQEIQQEAEELSEDPSNR